VIQIRPSADFPRKFLFIGSCIDGEFFVDSVTGEETLVLECERHPLKKWKSKAFRDRIDAKHSGRRLRNGTFEWHRKREVAAVVAICVALESVW